MMIGRIEVIKRLAGTLLAAAHQYRKHPYESAADTMLGLQMEASRLKLKSPRRGGGLHNYLFIGVTISVDEYVSVIRTPSAIQSSGLRSDVILGKNIDTDNLPGQYAAT